MAEDHDEPVITDEMVRAGAKYLEEHGYTDHEQAEWIDEETVRDIYRLMWNLRPKEGLDGNL